MAHWTGVVGKVQAEQPRNYPECLLRTVQRWLKGWRTDTARAPVFSDMPALGGEGTAGMAPTISAAWLRLNVLCPLGSICVRQQALRS